MSVNRANFDLTGLSRVTARLARLSEDFPKARQRALGTVARRVKAEAARAASEEQLNATPRALAPYINARVGGSGESRYVSVDGSRARLPLAIFKPKVSKRDGVRVTFLRGGNEVHWPHAFRPKGSKDIKRRIPARPGMDSGPSGLVWRLPITTRVGPSMARMLGPYREHGKEWAALEGRERVVARLAETAGTVLAAEIKRLLEL